VSDSPCEPSEEEKGRKVWNELRRLADIALLSQASLVAGMQKRKPGIPGATRSGLSDRFSLARLKLPYEDFVEAFVETCYDKSPVAPAGSGRRGWGTVQEWQRWVHAVNDGHRADSPLPPRRAIPGPVPLSEQAKAKRARLGRLLNGRGVFSTLRRLYPGHPLVELWGMEMPICVYPAPQHQWRNLEARLGRLHGDTEPGEGEFDSFEYDRAAIHDFTRRYEDFLEARRSDPEKLRYAFPGATFAFKELTQHDGGPKLDAFLSRYFVSMATSEALDPELMAAHDKSDAALQAALSPQERLELRDQLHARVEHELGPDTDPVCTERFRAAALSHATVVMLATGNGYDILLPSRSDEVASHQGFRHVAPSGILAPFNAHAVVTEQQRRAEFSVRRNFYREWIEELYDAKEYEGFDLEDISDIPQPPDPAEEPEIARLKKVIDPAQPTHAGDLYYTGVSVNLLTLRPEICLLLVIDDPGWLGQEKHEAERFERPLKLGWEFAEGQIERAELSPRHRLRLGPDLKPVRSDSQLVSAAQLVPNASAAIFLAPAPTPTPTGRRSRSRRRPSPWPPGPPPSNGPGSAPAAGSATRPAWPGTPARPAAAAARHRPGEAAPPPAQQLSCLAKDEARAAR
jgi:hypothetical protein